MPKIKLNKALRTILLGAAFTLTACQHSIENRHNLAQKIAFPAHLQKQHYDAAPFILTAYQRITDTQQPFYVYVEGDGLAWLSRRQLSTDPTPTDPIALRLAAEDHHENVIYLARPCQYSKTITGGVCSSKYWSSHRFSADVIASYNTVLDQLKQHYQAQEFHLTGFSGGGAVVSLLAAKRDDVASLRSVAGNLDHHAINSWHKVTLMPLSLNPANYTQQLQNVPQIHYSGSEDDIVPPWVAQNFIAAIPSPHCARSEIVDGNGHENGWQSFWRTASETIPHCRSE